MRRLTIQQAARQMRVHPVTIRAWIRKGILPDRRVPGTRKFILLDTDLEPHAETQSDLVEA